VNKRVEAIIKKRFAELTEIQKKVIPLIEEGRDVLIISPTGSGKTESAMIPILSKVAELEKKGVQVLYITPLKSLNRDILERMEKWCSELEISIAVRHGDTTQTERVRQNETPPQLIVTTPESLQSLLVSKMSPSLSSIKYVVVDELHELIENKRGAQLSIALERLAEKAVFQRIGLSATISDEKLAAEFISKKAVIVKVDKIRETDVLIEMPENRIEEIKRIINSHQSTLLFVNTRYEAEYLSTQLFNIKELKDFIAVHHSSLSKDVRLEVEQNFKKGKIKTILCTSSLELGIDIGTIEAVIQYNSPHQVQRFMQRIGRSGHSLSKKPKGFIICSDALSVIESTIIAKEMREGRLEKTRISNSPLDVLCHSIAGIVFEKSPVKASEIYALVKRAKPYESLTFEKFMLVLTEMHNLKLIFLQSALDPLLTTSGRTKLYYYLHLSMIPDEKKYFVKNASNRKMIAVLDEGFVSDYLQEGESFITQGKPWKVLRITEKEVVVEESQEVKAAIPDWEGEEIPVTMEIAREASKSCVDFKSDFSSKETMEKTIEFANTNLKFLNPSRITVETQGGNELVIHSFNGLKGNQTLSKLLGIFYKEILRSRVTPYAIVIESEKPLNNQKIFQILKNLLRKDAELLDRSVIDSSSFRHRFIQVAKRFSLISRDWNAGNMGIKRIIHHLPLNSPIIEETFKEVYEGVLDKNALEKICLEVEEGKLKVEMISPPDWTPLARIALEHGSHSELLAMQESAPQVIEAFKKNLQSKKIHLTCMYCNNNFYAELKENKKILCPYCGSKSVTLEKYRELFKLKKAGIPKMTVENEKAFQASGLINSYGVKALQALEVYGVGVQTAGRILLKSHTDENRFYEDLLEEQKKFLKNRQFWQIKGKR
jgi:ATP-dependent Lhr-like helicase